jgi:hypothetical protein
MTCLRTINCHTFGLHLGLCDMYLNQIFIIYKGVFWLFCKNELILVNNTFKTLKKKKLILNVIALLLMAWRIWFSHHFKTVKSLISCAMLWVIFAKWQCGGWLSNIAYLDWRYSFQCAIFYASGFLNLQCSSWESWFFTVDLMCSHWSYSFLKVREGNGELAM